ncbi:FUSC family protein [Ancylobacter sp. A5.8]|uniref:FUSC family protein n=1 Tax=Ancylobacter gelatini TaxID=2919920 RepID=UPI001F4E393C|nr:FUSC family protein [Ancylobacter gelatini]MCJ8142689.1 FUSC family protein [Ancylobacter gelatini]
MAETTSSWMRGRWHGDDLAARSIRFALTVMAPILVGLTIGIDYWLIYAMVTCILAFAMDTGGPALQRLGAFSAAGAVIVLGTGLGTVLAGHTGLVVVGFAVVGAVYALVESLHPAAAAGARFLCLTLAVGAIYAPLEPKDVGVVAGFAAYAYLVSLGWDWLTGMARPSTALSLPELFARLRDTERTRWVFAGAVAIAVPLAFVTCLALGLHRPYWALIAIVIVLRADALSSRRLMAQMLLGTLLGIVLAVAYGLALPSHAGLLVGMALAALLRWPAERRSGALGTAALTAFIMLLLELVAGTLGRAQHDIAERLIDVMVGCGFALVALWLDRLGQYALRRYSP